MGKEKFADKTKVIFSGTSTVADVEARMKVVLERGVEGIDELLDAWRMKNESDEPIRNRKLYCNKAFCAAGRKALGKK